MSDEQSNGIVLSRRQREILRLWMEGRTWQQVGHELQISCKTVAAHKEQMARKIGSGHPAALVRYAIRSGLTEA